MGVGCRLCKADRSTGLMDAGQDLPGASAAAQACSTGDQQVAYAAVDAAQPAQIPDAPSHGAAGAAAQQCGPGSDTAGQPAQPTEVKRKRGRPVGSLNRKTLERLERARMQEQVPHCHCSQLVALMCSPDWQH